MSVEVNPADIPKEELWDLDTTLAAYILPRLVAFRDLNDGSYPDNAGGPGQWAEIVDKMILAFQGILEGDVNATEEQIDEGLALFGTWFRSLWT